MSVCKICGGSGMVPIGEGIRGIKKCPVCNGKGNTDNVSDENTEILVDKKSELLRRLYENASPVSGNVMIINFEDVIKIVEEIL